MNPGEAMRIVQAVLRQNGLSTDQVEAWHDTDEWFNVNGVLVDEDLAATGRFFAAVSEDGTYKISTGQLGGSFRVAYTNAA
jgi:hypothetical protein